MEIMKALQEKIAPDIFTPRAVYDNRKNLFSVKHLFSEASRTFDVTLNGTKPTDGRPPKVYKVTLAKVAEINPELLARFIEGSQSNDNMVATAIMALNVVIRMGPSMQWPFNVRSFFTNREVRNIGSGITLWRGYFQSVRPGIGKMFINLDISTGMFYRPGLLGELMLDFLGLLRPGQPPDPRALSIASGRLGDVSVRRTLQHFLVPGVRVTMQSLKPGQPARNPRPLMGISDKDANQAFFNKDGKQITVAAYFQQLMGRPLRFPGIACVAIGKKDALYPIELLTVAPGQLMRKQVPAERTKDIVEFSTKAPKERLGSIKLGFEVLNYSQSTYLSTFNMNVTEAPVKINARVLNPPALRYAPIGNRPTKVQPRNGAWNMIEKKFHKPAKVGRWVVIVFEQQRRFDDATARNMVRGLVTACNEYGMVVLDNQPDITWENPHANVIEVMKAAGRNCIARYKEPPALIVVILPEDGNRIWQAVKHFGDVMMGIPTQCMKANKCGRAKPQYFANVCLKLNGKLGGINTIPDPESELTLTDPNNPTIVMGADVIHPGPGSEGRPSFAALVGNVDSETSKYITEISIQDGSILQRKEMITGLKGMAQNILKMYIDYRLNVERKRPSEAPPKRIIFYRDGVSEGEFQQVLDKELPLLRAACNELKIKPKITIIIVGKRHHVRFFPQNEKDAGDKLGNCPAGTVVDREIGHPTDFDFYLQSHGGLLGTSRPSHYSVLLDENAFSADALQNLSFALCHVYAPSTRSVSIPAPVYYADRVCGRAKNHFDPARNMRLEGSDTASHTGTAAAAIMDSFRQAFKPIHGGQKNRMFFL
jgi:eukaryotic translation initiation factor 2C